MMNFHAITGPNGMCMCGVDAHGTVVTCGQLLEAYIRERQKEAWQNLDRTLLHLPDEQICGVWPDGSKLRGDHIKALVNKLREE